MSSHAPLLQFALLSGFVLAITLAMLIAACERPLRRLLVCQAPKQRARLIWWLLVAPALAGIGYMVVTMILATGRQRGCSEQGNQGGTKVHGISPVVDGSCCVSCSSSIHAVLARCCKSSD
jgi:hypothetical protein